MFKLVLVLALALARHGSTAFNRAAFTSIELCSYVVFTPSSPLVGTTVLANADSIKASGISSALKTVIIVHGHRGSSVTTLNPVVKNAILSADDANVIVMDWSLQASLSYSVAVNALPLVSASLTNFITELISTEEDTTDENTITSTTTASPDATPTYYASLDNIHLVGFDLGAHVAGMASRSLTAGIVARITGLDPSGSGWGEGSGRLNIQDATYVEVLHTDGGGIFSNGIGVPLGHVDFFANGGSSQPGCLTHSCCHNRAFELFAASMSNPNLTGLPCSSMLQMNLNMCRGLPLRMGTNELSKIGWGKYRINTRRTWPF